MKKIRHIVWIQWLDASSEGGEHYVSKVDPIRSGLMESAGIYVREDDDTLTLAADDYLMHNNIYRDYFHVPKAIIRKRRDFRFREPRK